MKKLVYVVEDNPVQQKMLQVHFEQVLGDYAVETFSHPRDVLGHLSEKPFAVVLDHFFGDREKTGLDYLREIKKTRRNIPVIYYTTLNDESVRKQVLELGADSYIIKDSASLVRLRATLDEISAKMSKRSFFSRLFGK